MRVPQVCVWRWPTLAKAATLTGHTTRVLYLAASPDGQTIVTGAGQAPLPSADQAWWQLHRSLGR